MNKKTGGPAFPHSASEHAHGVTLRHEPGMSLRDYFAGQVLLGFCGFVLKVPTDDQEDFLRRLPFDAYRVADYMLSEREKE